MWGFTALNEQFFWPDTAKQSFLSWNKAGLNDKSFCFSLSVSLMYFLCEECLCSGSQCEKMGWKGTKWLLGQCLKNARFLRLLGIRTMYWNSVQPAKQAGIFSPQTGPGIFGSAADSVSLGRMFFVPNVIKTGLKYLRGMQLFAAQNIGAHHIMTASADWYHGRSTRCPLTSNFALTFSSTWTS